MFKREREAEDASFKPHPILRSVKSFDYRAEKEVIQAELNREKQRLHENKKMIAHMRGEELKLDDDSLRYHLKIEKATNRIDWMRENIGNTEAFLQENQYINHLAQQYVIHTSQQNIASEPNPDAMTYQELLELGDKIGRVSKGLSMKQMESLRRVLYSRLRGRIEQKCTICCEEYQNNDVLIELHCNHCYHEECVVGWLKEENICPLCKQQVLGEVQMSEKDRDREREREREK